MKKSKKLEDQKQDKQQSLDRLNTFKPDLNPMSRQIAAKKQKQK